MPIDEGQLQDIEQRQYLARMLMQQGLRPPETRTIGRVAIRTSPLEGLNAALGSILGAKMGADASKDYKDLARNQRESLAESLRTGFGQLESDPKAAVTTLASNPDTARLAVALAESVYKPKKDAPSLVPNLIGKYTPESIAAYQQTGDLGSLREVPEKMTPYQERELALREQELAERKQSRAETTEGGKTPSGYRKTESGDLEAIPGGPADQKAQAAAAMKAAGATDVDLAIGTLRDAYDRLEKGGGITNTDASSLSNLTAAVSSSGIGQAVGKAFGTQNQSARNDIAMTRPALLAALMKATGMSAKQMDSNAELKLWLATATDPTLDVGANRRALNNIEKKYLRPDAEPKAQTGYKVGDVIDHGGKRYRVTGGDPNDPDVEPIQ